MGMGFMHLVNHPTLELTIPVQKEDTMTQRNVDRRQFLQSATLVATAATAATGALAAEAQAAGAKGRSRGARAPGKSGEVHTRRWTEQRWLLDNTIRAVGVDWDQPRSVNYNAPCGPEANADFAAIRQRVQKFADISPAFESTARRREAKAQAAEEAGELVTARANYFMAAVHYAASQWPFDENNEKNVSLNNRKRECYTKYAKLADHRVEAAWIPFQGKALPGWFHLPHGCQGGRITAVWTIPGMDGFKEANVRSEEHTSELQSPVHLVCRLLLEKKNDETCLCASPRRRCPE